ncbi:MAG: hypothetical protein P4L56_30105 [Candidatus Sulfopaludibacter sp.]|nr:hypothetical protein [Candidatus Sulfopaludibacter sp.]
MTKMMTVLALALAVLASALVAGTPNLKTYRITLANPSRIGSNQLAPGDYKLAVDTASVRVTELKTGKSVEASAKVETGEEKFNHTAVTSQKVDGVNEIREIRLGGTKILIAFQ